VFSTHDDRVIAAADRLVRIEDGQLIALGVRHPEDGKWVMVKPELVATTVFADPVLLAEDEPSAVHQRESSPVAGAPR